MCAARGWSSAAAALLAACALLATPAAAAEGAAEAPADLAALFPLQADVAAPSGCLARLELPTEVLAACRPDLSDLRLFDAAGEEVAYAIDGRGAGERIEVLRRVEPPLLGAGQEREEPDGGPALWRERYELELPRLPAGTAWRLVFGTPRHRFVRAARVDAADAAGGEPLAAGSIFRLPEPPRERLFLDLPPVAAGRVTVTIEGEEGPWLEPRLALESVRSLGGGRTEVALERLALTHRPGRTEIELRRPGAVVPEELLLATSTPSFRRRVEVWDEGPGARGEPLGADLLLRLPGTPPVASLTLHLEPARGDRLRVVIDDGDSPPLADPSFAAVLARPALLFALAGPAPAAGAPPCPDRPPPAAANAVLRFGGGRAHRTGYDLAALVPQADRPLIGRAAHAAERLLDPAGLAAARLGPVREHPGYSAQPALAFAMRAGAEADAERYRWRRPLAAVPSAEGLNRLDLAADDVARARADLADLRLVDDDGRQRAYLLERAGSEERLELAVERCDADPGRSCYRLVPSAAPLAAAGLVLDPEAPFFDRPFTLEAERGGERERLAAGRIARRSGDPRPLEVALPPGRVDAWLLTVDDGDDAPLVLRSASGRVPLPALFFAAPAGTYELLVGDPEAEPPRYELERVRGVVLAVAAGAAAAGPLESNPRFSRTARLASRGPAVALWGAVALVVAVLVVLTLRLARGEGG